MGGKALSTTGVTEETRGRVKRKVAPRSELAFHTDGASVGEDDVLGDGKAEAGASGLAGAGFVDPVEALEDAVEMFRGDAGAEILHGKLDAAVKLTRADEDALALLCRTSWRFR